MDQEAVSGDAEMLAENADWLIRPEEAWRVVDLWWTDQPINRSYLTLRAPNGRAVAVCWDSQIETWSFMGEKVEA
jgi:hypothetical protein